MTIRIFLIYIVFFIIEILYTLFYVPLHMTSGRTEQVLEGLQHGDINRRTRSIHYTKGRPTRRGDRHVEETVALPSREGS